MDKKAFVAERAINLQGKEYLQVADRVIMFRSEHPTWGILTTICDKYVRAEVYADRGVLIASAHKAIKEKGEARGPAGQNPLETAETGAIGRALGLCGYGTKAGDLDEGEELADAPVEREEPAKKATKAKKLVGEADTGIADVDQLALFVAQVKKAKDADSLRLLRVPLREECLKRAVEDPARTAAFDLFLKQAEKLGLDLTKPD
jgi:hypothetical protein